MDIIGKRGALRPFSTKEQIGRKDPGFIPTTGHLAIFSVILAAGAVGG